MTSVPPKVPQEDSVSAPPTTGVDASATQRNRRLLIWLGVIGAMVCGLWWLSSGGEPPVEADPAAASDRGFAGDRADPTQRLDLSRHLRKPRGPHLFDEKRPNWDPARLRTQARIGLSRPRVADAAAPP